MSKPCRYEFLREWTEHRSVAEHEVHISFQDDSGAEDFEEWWACEGEDLYLRWCEGKEEPT